MRALHHIALILCVLLFRGVLAQKGDYFIHNFLPSQYLASDQNRSIIQDKYGRIIVANNDGLLINNGTEWLTVKLEFLCLSLAKNEKEEIFVGGDGNFGKLTQKPNGEYKVESLTSFLPKSEKEVNKIWSIILIKDHVYFCSNQKIYDYHANKIVTITPGDEGFHTFFKVGDHLVVKERGAGLKYLSYNNDLMLFKGGDLFADNSTPVRGIISKNKKQYIISPKGVFECTFNNSLPEVSQIKKISTPIDNWLSENIVYCAANIGSNHFAFGSVTGGLVITDLEFKSEKFINSKNELQDDGVNFIYNDYQGHIWLALAKGVSLIEFNNPVTCFTKTDGIVGTVEGCISFGNTIFIATDKGVLRYDGITDKFVPTNVGDVSWCLSVVNGNLITGTKYGLYKWEKSEFKLVYELSSDAHCMMIVPGGSGEYLFVGTETGYLQLMTKDFSVIENNNELNTTIRSIVSDKHGNIIMGSLSKGLYVVNPKGNLINLAETTGLDVETECTAIRYKDNIYVFNNGDVFDLISEKGKFELRKSEAFLNLTTQYAFMMTQKVIGDDIWLNYKLKNDLKSAEGLMRLSWNGTAFEQRFTQLSRIKESDTKSICSNDTIVYLGTNNGLYCYDTKLTNSSQVLNTLVNTVKFGRDSLTFLYNLNPNSKPAVIELTYTNNSIEVMPGASDFIERNELLFACYLEGLEDNYKDFSNKKVISYEYLHEGEYILHVKSKNILGKEGQEILIPFKVLPPWYRTVWAYIGYAIIILLVIFIIIKVYAKRLIEQNIKLENIIDERTKEIQKQKHEIEHKNQEITDSINYAKGIQDSILPDMNEIKRAWSDIFIFFQPKDIVSGDFYWFKNIDQNEFLIACCDCTGHGVPGAFMSMICSGKLHDAALISTEPDQLLFNANNNIKEILHQQGANKNKDGMEICILKINTKTRRVKYAGANRALWLFSAGGSALTEIKPTKASIASSTDFNFKYEMHEMELNAGDILYASSDGYADQFGGPSGKKYMTKNFKNFLLEKANLPLDQQLKEIRSNINTWMEKHEQVDDLLVIGVKL